MGRDCPPKGISPTIRCVAVWTMKILLGSPNGERYMYWPSGEQTTLWGFPPGFDLGHDLALGHVHDFVDARGFRGNVKQASTDLTASWIR